MWFSIPRRSWTNRAATPRRARSTTWGARGPASRRACRGPRIHRFVHEQPHRGFARGGTCGRWAACRAQRQSVGRAGIPYRRASGPGRRARRDLSCGGFRMAQAGLLDVRRREWGCRGTRRALRIDLESQFHRQARAGRAHASRKSGDRGRQRASRTHRRAAR